MASCPRCTQIIKEDAIACPYCGYTLAAYGHPGIPLHRADTGTVLCQTCAYERDNTCTFPQRPNATSCTLYRDYRRTISTRSKQKKQVVPSRSQLWFLGIACIIIVALLLAR